ncbi:hypothetical protein SBA4_780023 [Candidatus Sulfopaludibacter sp. SbA4]|nr:hypothetical protein SBA4_780023 [Candidatus Sulfopaludibacter sp. SbA4]
MMDRRKRGSSFRTAVRTHPWPGNFQESGDIRPISADFRATSQTPLRARRRFFIAQRKANYNAGSSVIGKATPVESRRDPPTQ